MKNAWGSPLSIRNNIKDSRVTSQNIQEVIIKYCLGQADAEEMEILDVWLSQKHNQSTFQEYVRANYIIERSMNTFNSEKGKKIIMERIKEQKVKLVKMRVRFIAKYAALFVFAFGLGYALLNHNDAILNNQTLPEEKEEFITLELDNGDIEIINPDREKSIYDTKGNSVGSQKGTILTYKNDIDGGNLKFNTLRVPHGKTIEISLADGTKVHLNSGSSLRYPLNFQKGHKRRVTLEGEAYFEVTSNAQHPFTINADSLTVEVLGTKFNVSAYPEDMVTSVVLLEGSVELGNSTKNAEKNVLLKPDQIGLFNKSNDSILTQKVNTKIYTAWMDGELIFRNLPFQGIIKKLERHFNVTIECENETINNGIFNASFNNEGLERILGYFNEIYGIDYTIENDTIQIK